MKDFFADELIIRYSRVVVFVFDDGKKGVVLGDYLLFRKSPYFGQVYELEVEKVPKAVDYSDIEDAIHTKRSDIPDSVMEKIERVLSEKDFRKFELSIELNELKS